MGEFSRAGLLAFRGLDIKQFALFFQGVASAAPRRSADLGERQTIAPARLYRAGQMGMAAQVRVLGQQREGGLPRHGDVARVAQQVGEAKVEEVFRDSLPRCRDWKVDRDLDSAMVRIQVVLLSDFN